MRQLGIALAVLLMGAGLYVYAAVFPMLEIATGYAAKYVCSCKYVAKLPLDQVEATDLQFSVVGWVDVELDDQEKLVRGDFYGFAEQIAVYREGLGCAIVHELPMNQIKGDYYTQPVHRYSFPWPGINSDTIVQLAPGSVDRIRELVEQSFIDPDGLTNTRAVGVFYKGRLVAEKYAMGATADTPLLGWSMTKSVTGTLVGRMEQMGKWSRESTDLVSSWDDDKKAISVDHLLSMNSGLEWEEAYDKICDATRMLYLVDGTGTYAASASLEEPPGTRWEYSSGTSNLMIMAAQNKFTSPREFRDFCYRELFHKLGIGSLIIENDASGYPVGSSYGWATLKDWAKIGQLYLNNGVWEGERLLPEDWLQYVQTPVAGSNRGYAGSFWLNGGGALPDAPTGMFSMNGFQGQRMFIIPEKDLIILRFGVTYNEDDFDFNGLVSGIVALLP